MERERKRPSIEWRCFLLGRPGRPRDLFVPHARHPQLPPPHPTNPTFSISLSQGTDADFVGAAPKASKNDDNSSKKKSSTSSASAASPPCFAVASVDRATGEISYSRLATAGGPLRLAPRARRRSQHDWIGGGGGGGDGKNALALPSPSADAAAAAAAAATAAAAR